jgi:predicted 3-demethylubiquinone-9 3-methyltransferase (glyoxalase superfamily)
MTINFQIEGQDFIALNGGPAFTFSQAISFLVNCETQEEIDRLWERLSEGGEIQQCGWLRDKYGVPWQITPVILDGLLRDPDKVKAGRVMESMLQMKKLDVAELKRAYEQD